MDFGAFVDRSFIVGLIDDAQRGCDDVGSFVGTVDGSIAVMIEFYAHSQAPVVSEVVSGMYASTKEYEQMGANQLVVDVVYLIIYIRAPSASHVDGVVHFPSLGAHKRAGELPIKAEYVPHVRVVIHFFQRILPFAPEFNAFVGSDAVVETPSDTG